MKTLKSFSFAVCFTVLSISVYGLGGGVVIVKPPGLNGLPGVGAPCTQNVANNAWLESNSKISLCQLYEKVGIGGSPFYTLHVRGETYPATSPSQTYIGINNSGTTAVGFDLNPSTGTKVIIAATGTGNDQGPGRLVFRSADSVDIMTMNLVNHRVGILTNNPQFEFDVKGTLRACTLRVNMTGGGCDYVFEEGYKKDKLSFVKDHTEKHHHLPGVESAKEMIKEGLNVSNMFTTLLKKIEEIFLHLFDFDIALQGLNDTVDDLFENDKAIEKKIDKLEKENKALNHKVDMLLVRINNLEQQ